MSQDLRLHFTTGELDENTDLITAVMFLEFNVKANQQRMKSQQEENIKMTTNTFIAGNYHVKSYGNGWAYAITDQTTGESIWLQDDDADQFREDTNDFENMDSVYNYFGND